MNININCSTADAYQAQSHPLSKPHHEQASSSRDETTKAKKLMEETFSSLSLVRHLIAASDKIQYTAHVHAASRLSSFDCKQPLSIQTKLCVTLNQINLQFVFEIGNHGSGERVRVRESFV